MARKRSFHDADFEDFKGYLPVKRGVYSLLEKRRFTRFEAACDLLYYVSSKPSTCTISAVEGDKVVKKIVKTAENEKKVAIRTLAKRWLWDGRSVHSFLDVLHKNNVIEKRVLGVKGAKSVLIRMSTDISTGSSTGSSTETSTGNNTDNQRDTAIIETVDAVENAVEISTETSTYSKTTKESNNIYREKAEKLEKFYFDDFIGKGTYETMMKGRVIAKKSFSEERIKDEIFKFYTHHQDNSFLLQKEPYQIHKEFEKWLSRDLCKPDKPKKNKRQGRIVNIGTNYFSSESVLNITLEDRFHQIDELPKDYSNEAFKKMVLLMNSNGKTTANKALDKITKEHLYHRILPNIQSTSEGFNETYRKQYFHVNPSYFSQIAI